MSESSIPQPGEGKQPPSGLEAELNLIEQYKDTPMGPILGANLDTIRRFDGIWIPAFKDPRPLSRDIPEGAHPDLTEDVGGGFVEFGAVHGPHDMASLILQPIPERITQEQYKDLSTMEQIKVSTEADGVHTIGAEYPEPTRKMLDDIHTLVGSQMVRDDATEPVAGSYGSKIFKGTYGQTTIYMSEDWSVFGIYGSESGLDTSYTVRSARVFGAESGEIALNALSASDLNKLEKLGISPVQARGDRVDRRTLESYIANINEINDLHNRDNK